MNLYPPDSQVVQYNSTIRGTKTFSQPKGSQHIHNLNSAQIQDVWEDNLDTEFRQIMKLSQQYRWIALDTEFPGVVYRPNDPESPYDENPNLEYRIIKMNVDKLKCIQIGISLCNDEGEVPLGISTWQFNLKFDKENDPCTQDSLNLLTGSGIQFEKHASSGVSPQVFAEYLISSGFLLNEDVTWICFHGGFDFGYLLKMINTVALPNNETEFVKLLATYFPSLYDLKYLVSEVDTFKVGGLSKLAFDLNVKRIGPQHQAGSDALLTLSAFMKLKDSYFKNAIDPRCKNILYGINNPETKSDYATGNFMSFEYSSMLFGDYINSMNMNMMSSFALPTPMYTGMPTTIYSYHPVPYVISNQYIDTNNGRSNRKNDHFNGGKK